MNRFIATLLAVCLIFTSTACTSQKAAPELRAETYIGSASYSSPDYNKTWHIELTFNDDLTFTMVNENGEEKGAGTYAQVDSDYTMTYTDGRTASFIVAADGSLNMTTDLPYGKSAIGPDLVDSIIPSNADTQTGATSK